MPPSAWRLGFYVPNSLSDLLIFQPTGVTIMSCQRVWMCDNGGFEEWNGK